MGPALATALFVAVALSAAFVAPAFAQTADANHRDEARALGDEAIALFDRGDFAGALERFERAEAMVSVPTLALRAARCLERLGRWTEASVRYRRAATMPVDATLGDANHEIQLAAQADAKKEGEALLAKLPHLVVVADGGVDGWAVDGRALPPSALGTRRGLDPGVHEVRAVRGGRTVVERIELAAGSDARVVLRWPSLPAPVAPPAPPPRPASSALRTVGWVALAAGAGGVVAGGITLGAALAKKGDLDEHCEDLRCGPDAEAAGVTRGDVDAYNTLATVSTTAFVAGAALIATGTVLLLAGSRSNDARRAGKAAVLLAPPRLEGATFRF